MLRSGQSKYSNYAVNPFYSWLIMLLTLANYAVNSFYFWLIMLLTLFIVASSNNDNDEEEDDDDAPVTLGFGIPPPPPSYKAAMSKKNAGTYLVSYEIM